MQLSAEQYFPNHNEVRDNVPGIEILGNAEIALFEAQKVLDKHSLVAVDPYTDPAGELNG